MENGWEQLNQFTFPLTGVDQKKTNPIRKERDTDPDSSSKAEQLSSDIYGCFPYQGRTKQPACTSGSGPDLQVDPLK